MNIQAIRIYLYNNSALWRRLNRVYYTYIVFFPLKVRYFQALKRNNFHVQRIFFYPEVPDYSYVLFKVCHLLGYKMTNNPHDKATLSIDFQDVTLRQGSNILSTLNKKHPMVNYYCKDISKIKVEEVFKQVFGCGLMINPLTYKGTCVKKSNDNAKHDGKLINCPANPEQGFVYQKIINNQCGDLVMDIRVPIFLDTIPFVYLKFRNVNDRFSNTNTKAHMEKIDKVLNSAEVKNIIEFCKKIGLDYGELDILRDQDDGKLYIVDVNNTPAGPPNHLANHQYQLALDKLASTFKNTFILQKN